MDSGWLGQFLLRWLYRRVSLTISSTHPSKEEMTHQSWQVNVLKHFATLGSFEHPNTLWCKQNSQRKSPKLYYFQVVFWLCETSVCFAKWLSLLALSSLSSLSLLSLHPVSGQPPARSFGHLLQCTGARGALCLATSRALRSFRKLSLVFRFVGWQKYF